MKVIWDKVVMSVGHFAPSLSCSGCSVPIQTKCQSLGMKGEGATVLWVQNEGMNWQTGIKTLMKPVSYVFGLFVLAAGHFTPLLFHDFFSTSFGSVIPDVFKCKTMQSTAERFGTDQESISTYQEDVS
ncbi:hypothetical protein ATANTOWER_002084 [Ataeniobius toweri]|uniref:Uncharacterized protein n=1 Tax=Ataeniobius toweri TaxID=208326 RepID=A0ABU7B514_9TELE|nr:hypothetical protein [Ataeniobius toweri]